MKTIPLTKGKEAVVDDEDYDYLMQWEWHFAAGKYAASDTRNASRTVGAYRYMHELVLQRAGFSPTVEVDHDDGDGLNNQRLNLRESTHSQNLANRGPQLNNTSGYKGVTWDKARGKWQASIKVRGQRLNLGRFEMKIDAARAYNEAALQHFGEFAYLNPL